MRHALSNPAVCLWTVMCILTSRDTDAAVFQVSDGDVAGLIAAINSANAIPGPDTIVLAPNGNYTLTQQNNAAFGEGANGLPAINGFITVEGQGAVIQRAGSAPTFRFFHVSGAGSLTLHNLTLHNGHAAGSNWAAGAGGAILNKASLTLTGSTLTGNVAVSGGAVFAVGGASLIVSSSTFKGNVAGERGGAIAMISVSSTDSAPKEITNSSFEWNAATGADGGGGAIYVELLANTVTVSRCAFFANYSAGHGGAIYTKQADLAYGSAYTLVTNSTVSFNTAVQHGGGLSATRREPGAAPTAPLYVTSTTFSNNTASTGGGIAYWRHSGPPGIAVGDMRLISTIVAHSAGGDCDDSAGSLWLINLNNLIGDGSCNPAFAGDPKLGLLADNGGPTKTHALLAGSPALNNGAGGYFCPSTDQRGVPRPVGPACEIGAWEGTARAADRTTSHPAVPFQPPDFHPIPPCDPLRGDISVTIPGDQTFDAAAVLPNTVTLGNAPAGSALPDRDQLRDVDGDGDLDLVTSFALTDVYRGLSCKSTTALSLQGLTRSGDQFFSTLLVVPDP